MLDRRYLDGNDILAMTIAGTEWLERVVPQINAMNVYPVPDGDCGTNMFLTLCSSIEEAKRLTDTSQASAVAFAIARGALMGARGNSGVILSQIWRGFSEALKDRSTISAADLALALQKAAEVAYRALTNPVEGTILTVIKDAARAAISRASDNDTNPTSVLEAAVLAARESVVNTPNLLEELREAGVLDAGGHGLYTFLEGALLLLKGGMDHQAPLLLSTQLPRITSGTTVEMAYGYCTQFIIKDCSASVEEVRSALEGLGTSLLVVGEPETTKVHIHTLEPQEVVKVASSFGKLTNIDINNMDEQHQTFLLMNRERMHIFDCAVVTVTTGDGLSRVFSNLNAAAVIQPEQTDSLSALEVLRIVEELPCDKVIILPNHKNILETALAVPPLTKKSVAVIPAKNIPQGIAAMIAFVPEKPYEANIREMHQALDTVHTIEVASSESTGANATVQRRITGSLNGDKRSSGESYEGVVLDLLSLLDRHQTSIVTIYSGKKVTASQAEHLKTKVLERYPDIAVDIVEGGQADWDFIISVE